ncbi:MAG: transcriptional repressor [Spirochaetia bacterium]|mgnify:CR=1 FL=1|jgi:Fur family ferric uptake transcriptional regulator|nr:transcriptional repressor [Spirochaetia bacterium]MDD3820497.1 Fur family transcriptional regulator [Spirochaetales bacterium]NLX46413.1 transcriptional repressor [Treponema sp.]VBB39673.1 Ferric uptake regulation protein [uncultured Spirochaetota bacterium]HAP54450.1 transcriptional repressor [Spirochaetaceae bacterium]
MKEEQRLFEIYLRNKGLKMTSARETVLQAFLRSEGHLSAEDLLAAAKRIDPGLGQATVFRTLKLLADAGLAQDACKDEGPRRYEHVYKHSHHDHLVCVGCGRLIEFCHPQIEKAQNEIFKEFGFRATGHRLELRGLCADCAKTFDLEKE